MFGKRLALFRKNVNLSQRAFAEKMNIPYSTVSRYEKDQVKPSLDFFVNIATTFDVNLHWLIAGNGSMELSDVATSNEGNIDFRSPNIKDDLLNKLNCDLTLSMGNCKVLSEANKEAIEAVKIIAETSRNNSLTALKAVENCNISTSYAEKITDNNSLLTQEIINLKKAE